MIQRAQEIFEIIERNPGATGYIIYVELARRSWIGKYFGVDSFWTALLAPSIGGIYVHLHRLEQRGLIHGEWGARIGANPRRRHYYARRP